VANQREDVLLDLHIPHLQMFIDFCWVNFTPLQQARKYEDFAYVELDA
jgi:hypothetical protein